MPFRDDDLALSLRVEALSAEVASAKAELAAKDAAFAPPAWVAWLLRPAPVIALSLAASVLLLPAGRALHRRALDEVRPAKIREALYAATPMLTRECVAADRYAEIGIVMSVAERGAPTELETTARAFARGGEPLAGSEIAEIERCVRDRLPQTFGEASRAVEVSVTLRLMAPRRGAR